MSFVIDLSFGNAPQFSSTILIELFSDSMALVPSHSPTVPPECPDPEGFVMQTAFQILPASIGEAWPPRTIRRGRGKGWPNDLGGYCQYLPTRKAVRLRPELGEVLRALARHKMPSCRLLTVFLRRVGDALKVVGGKMRRLVVDSEALLPAIKCTQMVA